jgi:serine/threonine-protein kinase
MEDDETRGTRAAIAHAVTEAAVTIVPSWGPSAFVQLPDPGYEVGEMIGHGGMGEVMAAQDQRIGREVAVKRIRSREPSPDAVMRFLREARIQARLDHPAIVPVYELGTDADGRPYFTMKRLTGVTLAKKLSEGAPVQRLLRAFVDVCLAIQLAHSRGVVHRDLKPTNIMLGDYGEVYVLDWGVARVVGETKRTTGRVTLPSLDDMTTAGAILGTPGYMSPEQVRGNDAGPKADVYALGAILFEILAGEPLHPRGELALVSTLSSPQEAPTRRKSDRTIPPELDDVCFDALAETADERPSAREVADRVQAYLDGDRDHERRGILAIEQLEAAQEALASRAPDARSTAMRRAGRALALDPESKQAAELVSRLLLEPPEGKLPDELVAYLGGEERKFSAARSRQGMWSFLVLFVYWLAIPFMHVRSWLTLVGFYGVMALGALMSWRNSRRGKVNLTVTLVMSTAMILVFTRFAGPFILTPIVICGWLMQLAAIRAANKRFWLMIGWTVFVVMLPFVLEWTHVLHATYAVTQGVVVMHSDVFEMSSRFDEALLVVSNLVFFVAAAPIAMFIVRRRLDFQRQTQVQAWHLQQLLPQGRPWQTKRESERTIDA